MDLLKAQIARVTAQLNALTPSQKMLTAALLAIMVITLYWWVRYAGDPEMEAVLDQSLSQDEISQITTQLQEKGIEYKLAGDKILVQADRKLEVLADLSYSHSLPKDFQTGFDAILKEMTPWDPGSKADAMYNHAKEITLAQVLSQFPGVGSATVMIDPTSEHRFDGSVQPSAMINIFTRGAASGQTRQLVTAAADLVCGAVAGMVRSRVNVIVDGISIPVQDKSDDPFGGGDSALDTIRQTQDLYCDQIRKLFSYIQGLNVSVTVNLDPKHIESKATTVDPKQVVHLELETQERTEDTLNPSASAEPGIVPNTGVSMSSPAASGASSSSDDTTAKYQNAFSTTETVTSQSAGVPTVVAASVQAPRSYFINAFKGENNGRDPADDELAKFISDETASMHKSVMNCCGLERDDAVDVFVYSDLSPSGLATAAGPAPAVASPLASLSFLGPHLKEVGVGALAMLSLFLMMMTVRKGAPPLPAPAALRAAAAGGAGGGPVTAEAIRLGEASIAGEVGEGGAMLDAVEVDDETVKTQQMLDQVQQMVTDNPDTAASLVKRWMTRL